MATLDPAALARLRTRITLARSKPDPEMVQVLVDVVDQILAGLEGYSSAIRVADGAAVASVGGAISISPQGGVAVTANDEITLKVGAASITLKRNGDVLIRGGEISVKANKDVVIKGSKIAENSSVAGPGKQNALRPFAPNNVALPRGSGKLRDN